MPAADGGIAQADVLRLRDPEEVGLGFALELVLLACIIRWAWTWHVTPAIPSLKR